MHYYIDGYNLLFRTAWKSHSQSLEKGRSDLIHELDRKAKLCRLNITVIFDAPLQTEELKRGHFHSLEIIFTAYGQTADDYIISYFETKKSLHHATLVSSDKRLQHRVQALGAKTEPVEQFLSWLEKKSRKKRVYVKEVKVAPKVASKTTPKTEIAVPVDTEKLPPLSDLVRWEELFRKRITS